MLLLLTIWTAGVIFRFMDRWQQRGGISRDTRKHLGAGLVVFARSVNRCDAASPDETTCICEKSRGRIRKSNLKGGVTINAPSQ